MKILLINPPSENEIMGNNPEIIESERGYNPPLGLLFIAGNFRENSKHEVTVIDCQVEELSYSQFENKIKSLNFDIVGITAMTFTMLDVLKVVDIVKKVQTDCKVILGGSHIAIYPEETISLNNIDYVIAGEGEIAFNELVDKIEENMEPLEIKGVVYKNKDGKIINNGQALIINDLDKLAFPARDITPYEKYSSLLAKRLPITTIFTSRGCPFNCSFCYRPTLGRNFRALTAKRVVEEIEECLKLGIHEFLVYDDTFTVDKKRVIDICNLIIEKKLDIGFDIRARVDTLNEKMLSLLSKAGCRGIHYGVESGTEKILNILKKGIKLEKVKDIFDLTRKYKMQVLALFYDWSAYRN